MQCEKCQLHSALHGETVCEICFWKYGKYPYYKKAMQAVSHIYGTTCGNRTHSHCVFGRQGWSVLPKLAAVGMLISVMKSTRLNKTPKTTIKLTDYFLQYWIDYFGFYNA